MSILSLEEAKLCSNPSIPILMLPPVPQGNYVKVYKTIQICNPTPNFKVTETQIKMTKRINHVIILIGAILKCISSMKPVSTMSFL